MPTKVPCLMSARLALITPAALQLSASLIVTSSPVRAFTFSRRPVEACNGTPHPDRLSGLRERHLGAKQRHRRRGRERRECLPYPTGHHIAPSRSSPAAAEGCRMPWADG